MSARAAKPVKQIPGLVLGGEPRADLLPPEVLQATKAKGTRRVLAALVVVVLILVAGGYAIATMRALAAQASLDQARMTTTDLISQQAQYSEVSQISTLLTTGEQTVRLATSTEVVWADVFDTISANLGPVAYLSWDASVPSPWEPALVPNGPLRQPRVATMSLVVISMTTIDGNTLFRALQKIEGFADATIDQVKLSEVAGYETSITLNLNVDALAKRFGDEEVSQ